MSDYIKGPWRRALDFKGRSTRTEYWLFQLQMPIVLGVGFAIGALVGTEWMTYILGGLLVLAFIPWFIASLAIGVRRLHDHDKSGWWLLIGLIPYVGGVIQLVLMLLPGDQGDNRYGYNPRYGDTADQMTRVFS
ncbi:DUF805 domain-containing protein [Allosphingosinicella deserti]|uniref:DUF805 domain-containing protein n=1 Tax=Allosphingosinicella deserti TaxID=2116704 RepID=A0A2P7QQY1_9SPHN|nr:DUF805 domain-containing protein [Sphingomonas deserti]PSJ40376.1 DUF805 domain-containing protein [Sphingomonas deserti]